MNLRSKFKRIALFAFLIFTFALAPLFGKSFTANVMAPLKVDLNNKSWGSAFQYQLDAMRNLRVDAVSVDVWWGMVEGAGDQKFDWSYYDAIFEMIINAGLKVQPIMSFHACGGNVGDTVNVPIPPWIWAIAGSGAKYIGEQNDPGCTEIVSVWAKNYNDVLKQYYEFMDAFEQRYAKYANSMQSINISCGPAGELRYPSYNPYKADGRDWGRGYPTRGYLQCYSKEAKEAFRNAMSKKYSTISNVNKAWGMSLMSFSEINPPGDGDNFFKIQDSKAYVNAQYGKDFIDWYNSELVNHGRNMLQQGILAFDKAFAGIELEIKIPGVHWEMSDPFMPRSAEVCAGLLNSKFFIFGRQDSNPPGGTGYIPIMNMVKQLSDSSKRHMMIYFTCLEMSNGELNRSPYSQPSALVFWVGDQAAKTGLKIKGENALAPNDGSTWNQGGFWWNIDNAIRYSSYEGITILRMEDVAYNQYWNFARLINNFK